MKVRAVRVEGATLAIENKGESVRNMREKEREKVAVRSDRLSLRIVFLTLLRLLSSLSSFLMTLSLSLSILFVAPSARCAISRRCENPTLSFDPPHHPSDKRETLTLI